MIKNISIALIAKNAQKTLRPCLESLTDFSEVIIYDNGSSDETITIAKSFSNVTVVQGEWFGFGKTKKHASSLATNDWIFSLDTDEHISKELVNELQNLELHHNKIYEVQRDNYYNNKLIKCCGWYGETIVRLYNRKTTDYNEDSVHEKVIDDNLEKVKLNHVIEHYSFECVGDFLNKIQTYSEIFAKEHEGKKEASVFKANFRGFFAFFKSYILRKGFSCGFEGFVISLFAGLGTTVKYLKLHERNKKLKLKN